MPAEKRSEVWSVVVTLTVEVTTPDEASEFVRAELLAKLGAGDPPWQTDQPHILPRWQVNSVRREVRRNEHGGSAEEGRASRAGRGRGWLGVVTG